MKKAIFLLLFLIEAQLSFAQSNPVNASVLDTVSKSDFRIPFWHPHFRGLHEYKIALERNNLFVIRTDNVKDLEDWSKVENTLNLFIKDFPQVVDSTRSPLESRSLLYLVSGNDRTLEIKYHTPQKESFRLSMTDGINQLKTQQDSVIIRVGQNEINKNYCILLLFNQIEDLASLMDELKNKFLKLNNNPKLILKPDNRNRLSILNVLNEDSNLRFEKTVKRADYFTFGLALGYTPTRVTGSRVYFNYSGSYNFTPHISKRGAFSDYTIGGQIQAEAFILKTVMNIGQNYYKKVLDSRMPLGYYLQRTSMVKVGLGFAKYLGKYSIVNPEIRDIKIYPYVQANIQAKITKLIYLDFYWGFAIPLKGNDTFFSKNELNPITVGIGLHITPTFNFSKKTN